MKIPYNKPYISGNELAYIQDAMARHKLSGDGFYTKKVEQLLIELTQSQTSLLTHSCTAALEMAAILIDVRPGDEIIMPSYTFVSTANAFVLRGGVPIFVDIRPDTFNLDENKIEAAITKKTKAIVPVHYAGVSCEMDTIMQIANKYGLYVIEDAAQGLVANYKNRSLGSIGHLGCLSFHDTKNIIAGEGGALLINDERFLERAHIIREKGTNRRQFIQGEVDKYTWQDLGSSYLPSELNAAFLSAQLENAFDITQKRLQIWNYYQESLTSFNEKNLFQCPSIPSDCQHNAHIYSVLVNQKQSRDAVAAKFKEFGIQTVSHYVPLHTALYAKHNLKSTQNLPVTDDISQRILRLPLWVGIEDQLEFICEHAKKFLVN